MRKRRPTFAIALISLVAAAVPNSAKALDSHAPAGYSKATTVAQSINTEDLKKDLFDFVKASHSQIYESPLNPHVTDFRQEVGRVSETLTSPTASQPPVNAWRI